MPDMWYALHNTSFSADRVWEVLPPPSPAWSLPAHVSLGGREGLSPRGTLLTLLVPRSSHPVSLRHLLVLIMPVNIYGTNGGWTHFRSHLHSSCPYRSVQYSSGALFVALIATTCVRGLGIFPPPCDLRRWEMERLTDRRVIRGDGGGTWERNAALRVPGQSCFLELRQHRLGRRNEWRPLGESEYQGLEMVWQVSAGNRRP